jgi:hypothetical protein
MAYLSTRSIRKTMKRLHISFGTVQRIIKEQGLTRLAGGAYRKGKYLPGSHSSRVAQWIRRHGWVKLPRSPVRMAFIIGCSADSVKCYLYRRRKAGRKQWTDIISTWNKVFKDTMIFEFLKMDSYSLDGKIRITSKQEVARSETYMMSLEEAERKLK